MIMTAKKARLMTNQLLIYFTLSSVIVDKTEIKSQLEQQP